MLLSPCSHFTSVLYHAGTGHVENKPHLCWLIHQPNSGLSCNQVATLNVLHLSYHSRTNSDIPPTTLKTSLPPPPLPQSLRWCLVLCPANHNIHTGCHHSHHTTQANATAVPHTDHHCYYNYHHTQIITARLPHSEHLKYHTKLTASTTWKYNSSFRPPQIPLLRHYIHLPQPLSPLLSLTTVP